MFGINSKDGYTEVLPGIQIKTVCYGENSLMTEFLLSKNSKLTEHSHIQEQTGYLVSGKIKLFIHNIPRILNAGDSWNISSNVIHKAEIVEDSVAIEVFIPCREEYKKFIFTEDIVE